MATNNPNLAFPEARYPFVDKDGKLTTPWFQFLIALYNRSGGSVPTTPTDGTLQALLTPSPSDGTDVSKTADRAIIGLFPVDVPKRNDAGQITSLMTPEASAKPSIPPFAMMGTEPSYRVEGRAVTFMQPPALEERNTVRNSFLLDRTFSGGAEGDTARSYAVKPITVTASPFTYTAPSNGIVIVSGGTLSALTFSRDGTTFIAVGFTSGIIPVRKKDLVRATYTVAPTMNFVPM